MQRIGAIPYNWTNADHMETEFSLNNRHKRAENTPGWYHAINYHLFLDFQLQFTLVKPVLNNLFS